VSLPEPETRERSDPRVSVIIPSWNGAVLLASALESLNRQTFVDFEVVVVDNGSSDGTVEMLGRAHPAARLVELGENRGFAAAVNSGISAALGDIIVLMNNDTEAEPGWLEALVRAIDESPRAGSIASRMLAFSDPGRIDSAGVQFGLYASQIGEGAPDGAWFDEPREVFAACAGAAAYRRRALDEVGGFDERYFAYFEDVDIGARLQLAGWRCMYAPGAVIRHHGSATSNRVPGRKFYLLMRNSLILFFQYAPRRRLVWAPAVLLWPFVRAVLDRQPLLLAWKAVYDFTEQLPAVLSRRRALRGRFGSEYLASLSPPLTRSGRPGPWSRTAG
jgi:GT2 family glycosyltransferase